ncbi:Alginate-lyase domain-containing protein [Fusarium sp. LHS14.1]|nr:Alginate-lyase domain-containing protein [Fusarium sp. LHS14.1]
MKISLLAAVGIVASAVSALHLHHGPVTRAVDRRASTFVHPGLLHSEADFRRIKNFVDSGKAPWSVGWEKVVARANPDYKPNPQEILVRGNTPELPENYASLYRDLAAAYALSIRWKVTQDTNFAEAAVRIVDAWAAKLTDIWGSSDKFLAAGLYGYQFANVVEILRTYPSWKGLEAATEMLLRVFYPMNRRFLIEHNGAHIENYWANWDQCNIASMMSIGALADNHTIWDEAIEYFKHGAGNGAIEKAIWAIHAEAGTGKKLGQNQEAGRDQGHATLDFALLGVIAQQAYNQGEDLFGYLENRILAGVEYMSKYNVGEDVPFTTYVNAVHGTQTAISSAGRGTIRPMAELFVAHYGSLKGRDVKWTKAYRDLVIESSGGAEGGGGDYGTTSGGYDQLGFGTLLYRLEA